MSMADPVTEFEQYRQELLAMLDGDDPVEVLRTTLEEVPRLLAGASTDALNRSPAPGEWSPRDVLNHLADSDLVVHTRVRMIVTQDHPAIVGYDQEAWTSRFGGLDPDPHDTIDRWQVLRRANLRMYDSLSPDEWQRVGVHSERGEESALLNVELQAGHDRMHLDQIRRSLSGPTASA
jgi:hypothetical protein